MNSNQRGTSGPVGGEGGAEILHISIHQNAKHCREKAVLTLGTESRKTCGAEWTVLASRSEKRNDKTIRGKDKHIQINQSLFLFFIFIFLTI